MTKYFRLFIAILMILGLLALAKGGVAWAAKSSGKSDQPAPQSIGQPDQSDKDPCNKNPDSQDCKDKEKDKDKDKCNPKKEDCGSVKPPPKEIVITVNGEYSVGGFCTLTVEYLVDDHRLNAGVVTPLPRPLPDGVHKVELGCLLSYYKSEAPIDEMLPEAGKTTICFANSPQKDMQIYFYDANSANPEWTPLETTVTDGIACAVANKSGVYVPTFETGN
jgi:hypothetical protein